MKYFILIVFCFLGCSVATNKYPPDKRENLFLNIEGYLSIISKSARGSFDYKKHFKHGELINLNDIYMNNHEAIKSGW